MKTPIRGSQSITILYSDQAETVLTHWVKRMFSKMVESWAVDYKVWRSEYAQPVTERNYSNYMPGQDAPFENARISTLAQIYPEDRGPISL